MITAIVPVWNGREHLGRLLDSLDKQTLCADEVLAVDNGSTDRAPDLARERGARVIAMGRNAGFAPAVNQGIPGPTAHPGSLAAPAFARIYRPTTLIAVTARRCAPEPTYARAANAPRRAPPA